MKSVYDIIVSALGARREGTTGLSQWSFEAPGPAWLLLLCLVAALGFAVMLYRHTSSPLRVRKRALLGALRFAVLALALLVLFSARLVCVRLTEVKPVTAFVVDRSSSMQIQEEGKSRSQIALTALQSTGVLEEVQRSRDAIGLSMDGRAIGRVEDVLGSGASDTTSMAEGLQAALRAVPAPRLEELVVVSDGRQTGPREGLQEAIDLARDRDVRISALFVGGAEPKKDLLLTQASTMPFCRLGDKVGVWFSVKNFGYAGREIAVEAVSPVRMLAATKLTLGESGTTRNGRLSFRPAEPGEQRILVRIAGQAGELTEQNNELELTTNVIDRKIRVLFVDGPPRFEYPFVLRALQEDPVIEVMAMNQMPGGGWLVQGKQLLEKPAGFPDNLAHLLKFDVVILGSLSRSYFSRGDRFHETKLRNLAMFVRDRGGGLVLCGGYKSFGSGKFGASPIEKLLPVVISNEKASFITTSFRAEPTFAGLSHEVTQFAPTLDENRAVWESLPELAGMNRTQGASPDAQVLAVHPTTRLPLIAIKHYGAGRVLACTTYSSFRWRLGAEEGGDVSAFERFWSQAVRHVAPDPMRRARSIRIHFDKPSYQRGDRACITIQATDEYYQPVAIGEARLTVTPASGECTTALAKEDKDRPGLAQAVVPLKRVETYTIKAEVKGLDPAEAAINVHPNLSEYLDTGATAGLLEWMAGETGGRVYRPESIAELAAALPHRPLAGKERLELPLRNSPLVLALLLVLALCEWAIRKRAGLA